MWSNKVNHMHKNYIYSNIDSQLLILVILFSYYYDFIFNYMKNKG